MGFEEMIRDFTLEKYDQLCGEIINSGYEVFTVYDYMLRSPKSNYVILRHDVDSRPGMALKMAELENRMDISATYYFRFVKGIFDPEIIRQINDLGHEIGYHYEVLSKAGGNFEEAIKLFDFELAEFRQICSINTICMHGSVLSKHNNRELWNIYDYRSFGLSGEAYLSLGDNFHYLSDTGWEWNKKHKLRDLMPAKLDEPSISSTSQLFDLISNNKIENIYLLIHPGNWTDKYCDWYYILLKNKLFNTGKRLLRHANNYDN
jgi:hypothetical protein